MHSQPTPKPVRVTAAGVCVVDGYGIELKVERGHLVVSDGIGPLRRWSRFPRATSRLRRLVLLGHAGFATLDALRWLADTGVGLVQLDSDGRLLMASAGMGRDDPRLRRAQAQAIDTPAGDAIARRLIAEKIAAQAEPSPPSITSPQSARRRSPRSATRRAPAPRGDLPRRVPPGRGSGRRSLLVGLGRGAGPVRPA